MGVSSPAGMARPRPARRSIRFTFAATVAVPTACMVVLWAVAVGLVLAGSLTGHGVFSKNHKELVGVVLLVAAGLVVVLAALVLMGSFARRMSRDIAGLAATARQLSEQQLPQLMERLRAGEQLTADGVAGARGAGTGAGAVAAGGAGVAGGAGGQGVLAAAPRTEEVAEAVAAITALQRTAVAAAAAEAGLRDGLRQVFVSLGRRNQSLLQRQLRLIDGLEEKAASPAALAELFTLDHLTTRMRRHAESLTILSGAPPSRTWSEPVPVIDVIRGAVAEVEDYKRVSVRTRSEDSVVGPAVADMIHLLAELIENATLFSPSTSRVEVRAERVANGFAIEIDDRGLGIDPRQLIEINRQLASPPDFDLANADRLGLFVGGRLAARHGVRVSLRPSPFGGTTAIVLLPGGIIVAAAEPDGPRPVAQLPAGQQARLDLRPAVQALALTGGQGQAEGLAGQPGLSVQPDISGQPGLTGAAAQAQSAPDGQAVAGTHRGLPRRTRQASLSPHLRDGAASQARDGALAAGHVAAAEPLAAPVPTSREPEQARDLAASLQSGWQRGRQTDQPGTDPTGTTPATWPQREPPQSEEN